MTWLFDIVELLLFVFVAAMAVVAFPLHFGDRK